MKIQKAYLPVDQLRNYKENKMNNLQFTKEVLLEFAESRNMPIIPVEYVTALDEFLILELYSNKMQKERLLRELKVLNEKVKMSNDIKNTKIHLCDSCTKRLEYPNCTLDHSENGIKFGDGFGLDNIIECKSYEKS